MIKARALRGVLLTLLSFQASTWNIGKDRLIQMITHQNPQRLEAEKRKEGQLNQALLLLLDSTNHQRKWTEILQHKKEGTRSQATEIVEVLLLRIA
jgi:hypothetical protein